MKAKPAGLRPQLRHEHDNGRVMLLKVRRPPVHFYRYLYETVGRAHVWVERTRMSDEALAAIVAAGPLSEVIANAKQGFAGHVADGVGEAIAEVQRCGVSALAEAQVRIDSHRPMVCGECDLPYVALLNESGEQSLTWYAEAGREDDAGFHQRRRAYARRRIG